MGDKMSDNTLHVCCTRLANVVAHAQQRSSEVGGRARATLLVRTPPPALRDVHSRPCCVRTFAPSHASSLFLPLERRRRRDKTTTCVSATVRMQGWPAPWPACLQGCSCCSHWPIGPLQAVPSTQLHCQAAERLNEAVLQLWLLSWPDSDSDSQ